MGVQPHCCITTIGWDTHLIKGMFDRIQERSGIHFNHIVLTKNNVAGLLRKRHRSDITPIRISRNEQLPPPDTKLLAELEACDIPTIHNMILGDRVLCRLPWTDALSYATLLAYRIEEILKTQKPDIVLGGFDSVHAGIGLAVCRNLGIPWVAMTFTTLPRGYMGFCNKICPNALLPIRSSMNDNELKVVAEKVFDAFVKRHEKVPAYISTYSISLMLKRMPHHSRNLMRRLMQTLRGENDRFNNTSNRRRVADYLRRSINMMFLPKRLFLQTLPNDRFAIYALHMQPESSIDNWEPFFADQLHLINLLVRAMPPNMPLIVKLHISDADNYSRKQLRHLMALPNVALVHPTENLRDIIERADLVFGIQGTSCLEAALLGKPVIMFGDSPYLHFPRVAQVRRITDLPRQIRSLLATAPPTQPEILESFKQYLARYMPAVYNNWNEPLQDDDIVRLTCCFERLAAFMRGSRLGEDSQLW